MENILKQIKDTEEENRLTGDYRKYRPLNLSSMNINDREFSLIVDRLNACPHIWKADFSDNLIQGIPEKGFLFLKSIDLVANKLSKEKFLRLLQRDWILPR